MIATVLRVGLLELRRDRVALAMNFLLPILFFSVFALVFGQVREGTGRIRVAVVDEDGTETSRRLVEALEREGGLAVRRTAADDPKEPGPLLDRARAAALVRDGDIPVAIVIPKGLRIGFGGASGAAPPVEMLADRSDPIAPEVVAGLLQKVTMTALPDLMMEDGISRFEQFAGGLTPEQRRAVDTWLPRLREESDAESESAAGEGSENPLAGGLVAVKRVDVLGQDHRSPIISFYAAGVGVMFLLFSAVGASGAILEEVESGTLDRVLTTRLGMTGLLAGKWLFLSLVGVVQLAVMFAWGALVFGLELGGHLVGLTLMTAVTSAAAAAFGLVFASACRTRRQLHGITTIVILLMSALGGSMFPRFLMSETMQKLGLFTFNGWALDGFVKVFWRNASAVQLWPQLAVLGGATAVFLITARRFARRWE